MRASRVLGTVTQVVNGSGRGETKAGEWSAFTDGMTRLLTTGLALCYCREPQIDRSTCHHLALQSENGSPAFQPFSSQSVWQKTAGSQSPCFTAAHLCGAAHAHVITHTRAHRRARKYCVAHPGARELNQKRCRRALNARCCANVELLKCTKENLLFLFGIILCFTHRCVNI